MEKNQKIEEALSIIWEEREKKLYAKPGIEEQIIARLGENLLPDLIKQGYAVIEADTVKFTEKGELKARDITRRQRLAERMLIDVLELSRKEIDSTACEFEHIISKEVEESICTLLGHPKECPHGLSIPQGDCCIKTKVLVESVVIPLSKLKPGEKAKIVYVLTHNHPQLHKLMSLGVVPGTTIVVHQVFPSFVIQVEETQIALEEDIAKEIYVKKPYQP